jgi:hypothetical protein
VTRPKCSERCPNSIPWPSRHLLTEMEERLGILIEDDDVEAEGFDELRPAGLARERLSLYLGQLAAPAVDRLSAAGAKPGRGRLFGCAPSFSTAQDQRAVCVSRHSLTRRMTMAETTPPAGGADTLAPNPPRPLRQPRLQRPRQTGQLSALPQPATRRSATVRFGRSNFMRLTKHWMI